MSGTALPDYQTAHNTIHDKVYADVMFRVCDSRGWGPKTIKEAQDLLVMAAKLRNTPLEKLASTQGADFLAAAHADLDQTLSRHGLDGPLKQAQARERDLAVKQAAVQLSQDPELYDSVLALKAEEARYYQAQLAGS